MAESLLEKLARIKAEKAGISNGNSAEASANTSREVPTVVYNEQASKADERLPEGKRFFSLSSTEESREAGLSEEAEQSTIPSQTTDSKSEQPVSSVASGMLEQLTKAKESVINFDSILDSPLGEVNAGIAEEAAIVTADIVPRIRQLGSLSDADLENEMTLLKNALLANPEAVSLMLPTDVGELVKSLRRITKEAIISDTINKSSKASSKKSKAEPIDFTIVDDF